MMKIEKMKIKTYAKIIAATMMITVAIMPFSVASGEDADCDGADDALAMSICSTESSTVLSGYNVLVTGQTGYMAAAATRISNLGASVTEAEPSTLTLDMLVLYDVVWISCDGADDVDNAGKADIVKSYVYNGGGLILEQPNQVITPQCLPYAFPIISISYENPCTGTILVPDHYLTQGLTIEDNEIPLTGDEVGSIGPEWAVLAIDGDTTDPDPKLSVACYGVGRIIVELGLTSTGTCVCGDCMKDIMIDRMITWAAEPCVNEGCSLGFWKNQPDYWECYMPDTPVDCPFIIPGELKHCGIVDLNGDDEPDTLMDALKYKGGNGLAGAGRNLLRQAVPALLNACNPDISYPLSVVDVQDMVSISIATLDRAEMLDLADMFDILNNLGCPYDTDSKP
jgi:hypothetical protein